MLSLLIPTYNYDCFPFVEELHKQLLKEKIDFEIICFDDGSKSIFNLENQKINVLSNCKFEILEKNIGRSSIRNLLVKNATYDWILFLDADGFPVRNNFINIYIKSIKESCNRFSGFIGGRIHKLNQEKNLRIKFGIQREELSVNSRNKTPYRYFFTSNVAIRKNVFENIHFNENLKSYGYEDLLFGNEMRTEGLKVLHINNPVYHLNIENNTVFIDKTKQGLKNLLLLKQQNFIEEKEVKLLKYYDKINRFGLRKVIKKKSIFFMNKAINTSSLFYYDLFKLSYLCYLKDQELHETE
jgi:glycosyltransferase involved in cell wall biosynthesis